MKGIIITEKNRTMLASRWMIDKEEWDEVLPLGYTLVVDFGNQGEIPFETVTQDLFDSTFNRLYDIENGWFAIERQVIIVPPTYDH